MCPYQVSAVVFASYHTPTGPRGPELSGRTVYAGQIISDPEQNGVVGPSLFLRLLKAYHPDLIAGDIEFCCDILAI